MCYDDEVDISGHKKKADWGDRTQQEGDTRLMFHSFLINAVVLTRKGFRLQRS